jgi:hypothetical protein
MSGKNAHTDHMPELFMPPATGQGFEPGLNLRGGGCLLDLYQPP